MGLRRVPRRGRVILIGLRPGVEATRGTQAGDHQHDDRHGTSDPRHSEFLSLSRKRRRRLRDWRLEPADRPALRRAVAADSTRRESLWHSAGPFHQRPARGRPHPDRVRQQEAPVAWLSPVAAWQQAFAGAVERNQNPRRRSAGCLGSSDSWSRRPGVGSGHHRKTRAIRRHREIVALIAVPDGVVGDV